MRNKPFRLEEYRSILKLALPIMIQNLFSAAISSVDVIMLNTVGQSAISSVSLAVQYSNILFSVYYGLGTGATMLCAQYWGKGDLRAIEKIEGIALRFSIAFSLLFALPSLFAPEMMMLLFTNDTELIGPGASYLRIISISYLCWGISDIYLSVLRSIERVKTSTALNVGALLLNIFFERSIRLRLVRLSQAGSTRCRVGNVDFQSHAVDGLPSGVGRFPGY